MITKEITFAHFNDLTDSQKEKVLDKNRDTNVDYDWWEYTIDDCKEIGQLMGFEMENIYFSGFHSQGDGACFTGGFSYKKNMVKSIKSLYPTDTELHRIAKEVQELYRKSFYTMCGQISQRGHYNHERSMSLNYNTYQDEIKGQVDEDEWLDIIADFACWIYKRLNNEYDWLTSDEQVAESLIANECEFELDEDGELV